MIILSPHFCFFATSVYVPVHGLSSLIQIILKNRDVDDSAKQNHVHAEIQPEHDEDNGRQAAVHGGESLKNVQVDGERSGK